MDAPPICGGDTHDEAAVQALPYAEDKIVQEGPEVVSRFPGLVRHPGDA
jgi:hypothetical protein